MSDGGVPAKLKGIAPYLARAQELGKSEPVIAYYCRMYATQLSIPFAREPDARVFVTKLFETLEREKKTLEGHPLLGNEAEASAYIESFAQKLFDAADKEDRAGAATAVTAKRYRAAQSLFELLVLFDAELPADIVERKKFCKWRQVEIMKAIKEGRPVVPPPQGDEADLLAGLEAEVGDGPAPMAAAPSFGGPSAAAPGGGYPTSLPPPYTGGAAAWQQPPPLPPAPSPAPAPPAQWLPPPPTGAPSWEPPPPPASAQSWTPPVAPAPAPAPSSWGSQPPPADAGRNYAPAYYGRPQDGPAAPVGHAPAPPLAAVPAPAAAYAAAPVAAATGFKPTRQNKDNAQKFARFAGSAINYDDITTAVKNLKDALFELTGVRH